MPQLGAILTALAALAAPPGKRSDTGSRGWRLSDPRSAVLIALGAVVLIGGTRRWLQGVRARRAVAQLADLDVPPAAIEAVAEHGREGILELFRLLDTASDPLRRRAAGRALATLWARDQLIVEEEKAIVTRGFEVSWQARRRYPRALHAPIPVGVRCEVPFLEADGPGVSPSALEWSYRITGAERAALETFSPWKRGPVEVRFELEPGDFTTMGPHRLIFQARARTVGLTEAWELALPHVPFTFEFDPQLKVESILTLPDAARGEEIGRAVRLEPAPEGGGAPRFLDLDADFALRDPPVLRITTPLACDLAHTAAVEFEDLPGLYPTAPVVLGGQGAGGESGVRALPLGPISGVPPGLIDHPSERRIRVHLTADPHLGWADPDIRSVWPGPIQTDWCPVRVIRR
jgi:hypothetical protein